MPVIRHFGANTARVFTLLARTTGVVVVMLVVIANLFGHEQTEAIYDARQASTSKDIGYLATKKTCSLTIELVDSDTGNPLPGSIRIKRMPYGAPIALANLETYRNIGIAAPVNTGGKTTLVRRYDWYSMTQPTTVTVPAGVLRIEAFYGLSTEITKIIVDLNDRKQASVRLQLKRFYDPRERGLRAGNTHLHLKDMTREQADLYLTVAPKADALDVIYISHLRRRNAEHTYITNSYTDRDLALLSKDGLLFDNGIEHRNNFLGAFGHGYGHVLLLHLKELIRPMSIGADIMDWGADTPSLRPGIQKARRQGGSTIWCHNAQGTEDTPNWIAGLLDAQNIFDGGNTGSYEDTFYKYLNIGLKTPFSTGSDWFIEDFSRVYVPIKGTLTSSDWLHQLKEGRSYITNGPFLEFKVSNYTIGETIQLDTAEEFTVTGNAIGRSAFQRVELIYNGKIVATAPSYAVNGHFEAKINHRLNLENSGWLALRLAPDETGNNEFGHSLFAHSSPIYIEIGGRRIFQEKTAKSLLHEMQNSIKTIRQKAVFTDNAELEAVLDIYREAIEALRVRSGQTY